MMPFDLNGFCRQCNVAEPEDFISKMTRLYSFLTEINREVNLTRIQSEEDYWIKHVADSLAIARYFPEFSNSELAVADIGCGGGFPSLVLASAFDKLRITAIDSIAKKTVFVESAVRELNLNNLEVVTGRSRELNRKPEYVERFDIVTARAVSDLRTLYKEAKKFIKTDGRFIFYKTPEQAESEIPQVNRDTGKHFLRWKPTESFSLPCGSGERLFVYSERRMEL